MATKLTKWIRECIAKDLLKHRFGDEAVQLVSDRQAFALKVYNDIYSAAVQKKMEALPAGWLGRETSIGVQFGDGRGYENLSFNGAIWGDVASVLPDALESVSHLVQHQHERGCVKVYDLTDPITAEHAALKERAKDLGAMIERARRQAEAALLNATTINKLVEIWPEIEPFASKYETEPKPLPALPTGDLNALLDLPVSEAA